MTKILELILKMVPRHDATPEELGRYRIMQVVFAVVVVLSLSAAYGHVPWLPGFAYAQAVDSKIERIEKKIDRLEHLFMGGQIKLLQSELFTLRKQQCEAKEQNNVDAMRYFSQRLSDSLAEYKSSVGATYDLPDCSEI